ncbi:hypothetical protein N183_32535 [Sinorhizobium sp. Sb3]|nr:hypothetical protein N183_32535 [Sinorhizobium sp. Sb3]
MLLVSSFVAGTIPALAQQTVVPAAETPSADPATLQELIDVLRDDHARGAFLDELQKVAGGRAGESVEDTAPDVAGNSLGERAADITRRFGLAFTGYVASVLAMLLLPMPPGSL